MKKVLSFILLLLIGFNSFSQDKGHLSVSAGASIPLGNFAVTDFKNENAGFATVGEAFQVSFAYLLSKNIGFSTTLMGQFNPIDGQKMADETGTDVEATSWSALAFAVGPYFSFPLSEKISIELKPQLGFLSASSPEYKFTQNGQTLTTKSESGSGFAYLVDAGLKINLSQKFCLLVSGSLLGSNPTFKSENNEPDQNQAMNSFNVNLGIGYRFGN